MKADITLVLGGARSGKSAFAEKLVQDRNLNQIYIATAEVLDDEMHLRVEHHKESRGRGWLTVEEPIDIASVINKYSSAENVILVDCLTLWLSNIMAQELSPKTMFKNLVIALENAKGSVILVSNEVGLGIVPSNALAREFRDEAGRLNQMIAQAANNVYFTAAGLPMQLKKDDNILLETSNS